MLFSQHQKLFNFSAHQCSDARNKAEKKLYQITCYGKELTKIILIESVQWIVKWERFDFANLLSIDKTNPSRFNLQFHQDLSIFLSLSQSLLIQTNSSEKIPLKWQTSVEIMSHTELKILLPPYFMTDNNKSRGNRGNSCHKKSLCLVRNGRTLKKWR